ncbi:hypothetical protein DY000_02006963 [Brassica cretica]|uniref:peptidylprolyl isomerase n=1 Tax=Brassica cretica TaxID=69181 RepID=A0ABQ7CJ50_BRACR|nr:hypothetical protein DY000_02006963 [Brassica cretica]
MEEEPKNGSAKELAVVEEEEPMVGPGPAPRVKRKRPLQFEQAYLDSLPCANMYEKSYMHRDVVTHVAVSAADFFITGSIDGHLKFWKKKGVGIEFAKHFRSHLGPIEGLAVSVDGLLCCTISNDDHAVKIYDIHSYPVKVMKYNPVSDTVISGDTKGIIEYWSPATLQFPEDEVDFKLKSDTNLFEIIKCKTTISAIEVSPDGRQFSVTSPDRRIRVFWFETGKLRRVYDESLEVAQDLQRSDAPLYRLEAIDFGRRMAVEKELEKTESAPQPNAVFDESSNFLIFATLLGIKIVNLQTNTVARILGKVESNERYLRVALYQGDQGGKKVRKIPAAAANVNESKEPLTDPTILCCAFKKHRIYMFSRREPEEPEDASQGRDVFNEKPSADELMSVSDIGNSSTTSLPENVIMHTTMGDMHIKLYPEECPKTVENFTTHCRNGYYDNHLFHRVIKGFMVQTGDPLGDGTGGQSIWGREFEDEFHKSLRHDRPFTVSMANAGQNTNGSQFFITTVATPWLDNKHTVFGRVVKGMDVVQGIEKVKTDKNDRPYQDVKILNVTVPKS